MFVKMDREIDRYTICPATFTTKHTKLHKYEGLSKSLLKHTLMLKTIIPILHIVYLLFFLFKDYFKHNLMI